VLEYVETHFSEPITLDALAKIVGMNPKYFCRFFSSITQQTPMNYVNYYRIEQAVNLLNNTNMSVTEVGLECGFNDTGHFVKTFKKYKGITPKQFQKRFL
jgi:AraC-like DNA-binding protein